jgi:hypothetical protein
LGETGEVTDEGKGSCLSWELNLLEASERSN